MKFGTLVDYLEKLEAITSRLEMNSILKGLFTELSSESEIEIKESVYLLSGAIGPEYVALKFNVSDKTVRKVLVELFGEKPVINALAEAGDYGSVFQKLAKTKSTKTTVSDVYRFLLDICNLAGAGSAQNKQNFIKMALSKLSADEGKYFIRILLQQLRVGFSEKTIIESLSVYVVGDKSLRAELERVYGVNPDMGILVFRIIKDKEKGLEKLKIIPGIPVKVKLVQREAELYDILERFSPAFVQPKYDGVRCQVHISKDFSEADKQAVWQTRSSTANNAQGSLFIEETKEGKKRVRLFTRNLEDITEMFPDVIASFEKLADKYDAVVFDTEIISRDPENGRFQAFQETMKRKRKYGISEKVSEIPVEVFAFDLIYLEEDLTSKPLDYRLEKLEEVLKDFETTKIHVTDSKVISDASSLEDTFQEYIKDGLEGLIAKDPKSIYKVGTRNYDWIKFKRASRSELADSVDVVVMGYYAGRGRQVKFGIGAFLVGIYDKDSDKVLTLAKVGTGVTDQQWGEIYKKFEEIKVPEEPKNYQINKSLKPDVFVRPEVICVIEADEITKSPIHTSGYALRFPRLKEFGRIDKGLAETTTREEVENLHQLFLDQLQGKNNNVPVR